MEVIRKIVNQISPYMKSYGYKFSQKCFYRIQNDIAYCVQFDVPSGFVYASFFIMPLYMPCKNRYYTYGNRISSLYNSRSLPLPRAANDEEIEKWCTFLCSILKIKCFLFGGRFQRQSNWLMLLSKKDIQRALFSCAFLCKFPDLRCFLICIWKSLQSCL